MTRIFQCSLFTTTVKFFSKIFELKFFRHESDCVLPLSSRLVLILVQSWDDEQLHQDA